MFSDMVCRPSISSCSRGSSMSRTPMHSIDAAVDELAHCFAVPPSDVKRLVLTQIGTLDRTARIKQFVTLLAIKHVRATLRKQTSHQIAVVQDVS